MVSSYSSPSLRMSAFIPDHFTTPGLLLAIFYIIAFEKKKFTASQVGTKWMWPTKVYPPKIYIEKERGKDHGSVLSVHHVQESFSSKQHSHNNLLTIRLFNLYTYCRDSIHFFRPFEQNWPQKSRNVFPHLKLKHNLIPFTVIHNNFNLARYSISLAIIPIAFHSEHAILLLFLRVNQQNDTWW